ncbi:MAG TPA: CatB-related O-acetyltransferase, partial [Tabrizicola sp.]
MRIRQFREGAHLTIGSFCSIARGLRVYLGGDHRVDWCTTFPFGHIFQGHLIERSIKGHPTTKGDIVIGNDVWISEGATIFSGVTIGDGAVIAGNATVARDVGPYEIWGGNPARFIRPRFAADVAARLQAVRWWDCPVETIRELAPLLSQPPEAAVLDLIEELAQRGRG